MDIHRCRFVKHPAEPIHALAFSHSSSLKGKTPSGLRLALGRGNGDVEIWNPQNGHWVQEVILKGKKNSIIEQLAWTRDLIVEEGTDGSNFSHGPLRLFSSSGSNSITEWDVCSGAPKRQTEGNFGDIWCFAAQPQIESPAKAKGLESGTSSQLLAAGCGNGTVILFSTEENDLRYLRPLLTPPVKKPRVVSITWRDRNTVVAGYEDSAIRVIDVRSRTVVRNMSLGKPADGDHTIVWTVKCLPDGTIISGDSTGELKIWDAKNFSLVQRLKSHTHDIIDLAMSATGDTVFSFGVDRRTVSYKAVASHTGSKKLRWAEVSHRRYHRHDVKCSAAFESSDLSVLVSGGMDCRPVVVPIRKMQTETHRTLSHLQQRPVIASSPAARLFISWWNREIVVYQVRKSRDSADSTFDFEDSTGSAYETLTRLMLQGDENIQDAQISADGQFIAAATINTVKLFQLRKTQAVGRPCVRTRQIELPSTVVRLGARQTGFSPDGKWLYTIRKDNTVALNKIVPSQDVKERPTVHDKTVKLYRTSRNPPESALGTYRQTISHVAFSSDSRVLAVSDLSGAIDTWLLEGHEDLDFIETAGLDNDGSSDSSSSSSSDEDEDESPVIHAQKWIRNPSGSHLPQLDSSILAMTFRPSPKVSLWNPADGNLGLHATRHNAQPVAHELPSSEEKLIAVTATHQLVEFDVLNCRLSDWSRRNPSKYLPHAFTRLKDRVVGCFWDCTDRTNRGERLWLYGLNWLFMLDVSQDLQYQATKVEKVGTLGRYDVLDPVSPDGKQEQGLGPKALEMPNANANANNSQTQRLGGGHHAQKKRKRNTGAGDAMPVHERGTGLGSAMLKYKTDLGDADVIDMDVDVDMDQDTDAEVDDEDGDDMLALMRRGEGQGHQNQNAAKAASSSTEGRQSPLLTNANANANTTSRPLYWSTFAYHGILGIGVIGPAPATPADESTSENGEEKIQNQNQNLNLEVVIVERDIYELVQKAPYGRIDAGQDWET
ncbi:U3 small nucleolar RNA-associated protein [Exophiala xenobiotica]|nr:U3 small nucleolar RNA-associated protein [Exophiala xenobiotica]